MHEKISLRQCLNILSEHDIIVVKPKSLELCNYEVDFDKVVSFDDMYFKDIQGYNRLMLSASFYETFIDYAYILIYQLDAFVFKDDLLEWCDKGFDYIGAPWLRYTKYPDKFKELKNKSLRYLNIKLNLKQSKTGFPTALQFENKVGNGGFSLRRTSKFLEICIKEQPTIDFYNSKDEHYYNEDVFFSIEVNRKGKQLNIPDYKQAAHFAIENNYKHGFQITQGALPFGCHAWDRYLEFWQPIFIRYGVVI